MIIEVNKMDRIRDCICTRCLTTSTYCKDACVASNIPVCAFCGVEMKDVLDVALECVRDRIDARKKED